MQRKPPRKACDRCHGLKLRCDRSAAAKHCRRCLKASATCVFRPPARRRQSVVNKSPVSTRPARKRLAPCNSMEDASVSESPVRDSEENSDTCMQELPPSSMSQSFPDASLSSSDNPTGMAPNPLPDVAFSDCYSTGQTPDTNDGTWMDFLMNLTSPRFDDGNAVAPKPSAQTQFRVQFIKDVLVFDVELIQHTSTLASPTDDGLSQAIADKTLTIAQQLLKVFQSAECWTSHASCPHTWYPYLYPPSIPSQSEQSETSLDQASIIYALSTYLRLVEVYQILFTRAASNYDAVVANGSWSLFPSSHIQEFAAHGSSTHPDLSIQSAVPLLDRLSCVVQLLTMPFIGANVVRALMATVREHEGQMMQGVSRLQQIVLDSP